MKIISITKGYSTIVDDDCHERISKFSWYANVMRNGVYAYRGHQDGDKHKTISMAREILSYTGPLLVDHINHNTLDNRRCNLRIVARNINNVNHSRKPRGAYKMGGNRAKPWLAQIVVNKVPKFLGYFATEQEAKGVFEAAHRQQYPWYYEQAWT